LDDVFQNGGNMVYSVRTVVIWSNGGNMVYSDDVSH